MDADTLFNEISETFLGSPHVTTAKMFGGSALKVSNKVFACFYKGKLVVEACAGTGRRLGCLRGRGTFRLRNRATGQGMGRARPKPRERMVRPREGRAEVRRFFSLRTTAALSRAGPR